MFQIGLHDQQDGSKNDNSSASQLVSKFNENNAKNGNTNGVVVMDATYYR